jgi:hypothetical protein
VEGNVTAVCRGFIAGLEKRREGFVERSKREVAEATSARTGILGALLQNGDDKPRKSRMQVVSGSVEISKPVFAIKLASKRAALQHDQGTLRSRTTANWVERPAWGDPPPRLTAR